MNAWNYEEMAANMKPHQFELLLRAYVRQQAMLAQKRAFGDQNRHFKDVRLGFDATVDEKGVLSVGRWAASFAWDDAAKGEILEPLLTELCRREGWSSSPLATLRQIEGPAAEGWSTVET